MYRWSKAWFGVLFISSWGCAQNILTTTSVLQDMAAEIAPAQCSVQTIVPRGMDPHTYEAIPSDVELVQASDLIFKNGLKLEGWLEKIIENAGKKGAAVTVTAGIQPITSQEYEGAPDPHAWMDLMLGKIYVKNIRDALITIMPDYADTIEMKYLAYVDKIERLDRLIKRKIKQVPEENRVLITSHDAFQYFGRAYGLELHSLQGLSTDTDIKTGDILNITNLLASRPIPAIFVESTINPKVINQIAKDYHVKIGGELYADALSSEIGPADTYLNMLKHNASVISKALQMKDTNNDSETLSYARWISYGLIFSIMLGLFISAYYKLS